jgi:uncharacterized membrane protein
VHAAAAAVVAVAGEMDVCARCVAQYTASTVSLQLLRTAACFEQAAAWMLYLSLCIVCHCTALRATLTAAAQTCTLTDMTSSCKGQGSAAAAMVSSCLLKVVRHELQQVTCPATRSSTMPHNQQHIVIFSELSS